MYNVFTDVALASKRGVLLNSVVVDRRRPKKAQRNVSTVPLATYRFWERKVTGRRQEWRYGRPGDVEGGGPVTTGRITKALPPSAPSGWRPGVTCHTST